MARALPLLGLILWFLPLLWPDDAGLAASGSTTIRYIFGVWCFLILCAAIIGARMSRQTDEEDSTPSQDAID